MLNCQGCLKKQQNDLLTRCCKLFICEQCKDKYEKNGTCICGKTINKKLCSTNPELYQILKTFQAQLPPQCDRCQQPATLQCKDCQMIFCMSCNNEVHGGAGFARHQRQPYVQHKSPKKNIQKFKKKQQICKVHQQMIDFVCECGMMLCGVCVKNHKELCAKTAKTKPLKQFKEEFFSQIYFRIKQITQYKEKLQEDKKSYEFHFQKQKQIHDIYQKAIKDQLEGLKKILIIKTQQIQSQLEGYWKGCQNAHNKNLYAIQYQLKKYDDYARLSEKFTQNYIGLDYLEKRVKRYQVSYDFFSFKVCNIEEIQSSIVNLNSTFKEWQINNQQNVLIGQQSSLQQKQQKDKKIQLLGNVGNNASFLLQCSQKPLQHRPLTLKSSHQQIQFEFLHLPYQNDAYEIEYGVGLKMKGQEVFKKILNNNGKGIITNLNSSTKYRVRMKVNGGEFGPVQQIRTQEIPKFSTENSHSAKTISENSIQLVKAGTIYGINGILFGVHGWEIRISPAKNQQQTACISIGVSNKETKRPIFVGSTLNYGYQKGIIIVKAMLNCEENKLIISSTSNNQDEVFQNLPNYPIYPTIMNKGNSSVNIVYNFL